MADEHSDDKKAVPAKTADGHICAPDREPNDANGLNFPANHASGIAAAAAKGAVARALAYDDIMGDTEALRHSLKSPKQPPPVSMAQTTDAIELPAGAAPSLAALAAIAAVTAARDYGETTARPGTAKSHARVAADADRLEEGSGSATGLSGGGEARPHDKPALDNDLKPGAVPVEPDKAAASIAVLAAQDAIDRARTYDAPNGRSPRLSMAQLSTSLAALIASTPPAVVISPVLDIGGGDVGGDGEIRGGTEPGTALAQPAQSPLAEFIPDVEIVVLAPPPPPHTPASGAVNYTAQILLPEISVPEQLPLLEPPIQLPEPEPAPEPAPDTILASMPAPALPPHGGFASAPTPAPQEHSSASSSAPASISASANAVIAAPRASSAITISGDLTDRAPGAADKSDGRFVDVAAWRPRLSWLRAILRIGFYVVAGYAALCVALIFVYRFVDPPTSNLMLWQRISGTKPLRKWVPLNNISPNLIRAVIASEDARFCRHGGVDFTALRLALRQSGGRYGRGASTISMQVTKNLFLWSSRSYVRKAIEIPLTILMELVWPKWRVMEVYLNIAEWGEGIFGAQAAAAYHFSKPARRLSARQAALLAVLLPNPIAREAGDPSPKTRRRAARIEKRVKGSSGAANCVLK